MGEAAGVLHSFAQVASVQLLSKACSFFVGLLAARKIGPSAFVVTSVHFHLLEAAALCIPRDGLRKFYSRSKGPYQSSVNVAWLGFLLGCVCLFLAIHFLPWSSEEELISVRLFSCGLVLQLLVEPWLVIFFQSGDLTARSAGEGAAVLMRAVALGLALLTSLANHPLIAVALGHFIAGIFDLFTSIMLFIKKTWGTSTGWPLPRPNGASSWFEKKRENTIAYAGMFIFQAVQKAGLAESEKFAVLAINMSKEDMSAFGLASNLGSIAARVLLAPFEEASSVALGRADASVDKTSKHRQSSAILLPKLLRCASLIFCLGLCLGPPMSPVIVKVLYGKKWDESSAASLLSLYTVYISVAALNGVSEAFYHSTGNLSDLGRSSVILTITVLGQSVLGWALGSEKIILPYQWSSIVYGSKGIIYAMMLGMIIRMVAALQYAVYQRGVRIRDAIPSYPVIITSVTTGVIMQLVTTISALSIVFRVIMGILGAAAIIGIFFVYEERVLRVMRKKID